MEDLDNSDQENYFEDPEQDYNQQMTVDQQEEEKVEEMGYQTMPNQETPTYALEGLEPLNYQIMVCDPTIKDGLTKYYIYTVKGTDSNGAFDVLRRYRDFASLRNALI